MAFQGMWQGSRQWSIAPAQAGAENLARQAGVAPLVAQVLMNRGVKTPEEAKAFLNPKLTDLHDPETLPGAVEAAKILAKAVADKKRIVIYGDYDVDGITAVAILHAILHMLGSEASFYIPHRLEEGYGVNSEAVRKIIADGAQLMVTVDCGISAAEQVAEARRAGLDVIVTDHHAAPETLPDASAIVHPDVPRGAYPNPDLAGAGVAFKLAWQLAREVCGNNRVDETMREFLLNATCLAALGTIADVVPLTGENRALAVYGLKGLPETRHAGLRALLDSAGLVGETLDAYHVGFLLAPRLNACGRMGHASLAVELLTDAPPEKCETIAEYLNQQNTERQRIEKEITAAAAQRVLSSGDHLRQKAIVLASEEWHGGVIGIVASRMVDQFRRPAVLLAVNGDEAHGSCRSIPGFHMRDALAACSQKLLSFGGHAMAGGLRLRREHIEEFTEAFRRYAIEHVAETQLSATLAIDAETTLAAVNYQVAENFSRMAPFGQGNPPPVVVLRNCRLLMPPKRLGRSGQTISFMLGSGDARIRAVGFQMGDLADRLVGVNVVDVAASPQLSHFNGTTTVELKLIDVQWES
jgi:single-stranded-DNA-specific exonuclease